MGFPPPKDAPPPSEQDVVDVDAGFSPSPTGAEICGFGIPSFSFALNPRIPGFPSFAFPTFDFMIALKCDLSDPIDAEFAFGGGRIGSTDVDADDEIANI